MATWHSKSSEIHDTCLVGDVSDVQCKREGNLKIQDGRSLHISVPLQNLPEKKMYKKIQDWNTVGFIELLKIFSSPKWPKIRLLETQKVDLADGYFPVTSGDSEHILYFSQKSCPLVMLLDQDIASVMLSCSKARASISF